MIKIYKMPQIYIKTLIVYLLFLILFSFPLKTEASIPVYVVNGQLNSITNLGTLQTVESVDRVGIVEAINDLLRVHEVNKVWELQNIQNIQPNTDLELSLEIFLLDLFNTLAIRQESFLKTFELAKIEKARNDVNKLMFETQRELTDQGIIVETRDPVTGKNYTIKKEGRIITNPDDFLFEEPVQKARDFVYCYLAPWKHFSWGNDRQYCGDLGLSGDDCNTPNVCAFMPQDRPNDISQCPSDDLRDSLKQRLLNSLIRKKHKWQIAPPESWYTPAICESILNSFSCVSQDLCFTDCKIDPHDPSCKATSIQKIGNEDKAKINETHSSIPNSIAFLKDFLFNQLQEMVGNPNNNANNLERILVQQTNEITGNYQMLRQTQYNAGQGIRPEKFLLAFLDKSTGCDRYLRKGKDGKIEHIIRDDIDCATMDEAWFGRTLTMNYGGITKSYKDFTFWFDTENIISPAIVLLQKMAAATQAQFDLARQGYRYPAFNSEEATTTISNLRTDFKDMPIVYQKPTIRQLSPPWMDEAPYAKLPKNYITDTVGKWPPEIGENFYLNRWYKDINQMYLPQADPLNITAEGEKTFSRILAQWFCEEGPPGGEGDWNCLKERKPKEYPPNIEDIEP